MLANGKVLLTGGDGISGALSSAELYDPVSNRCTAVGSLAAARTYHTASVASAAAPAVLAEDGIAQVVSTPYPLLVGGKPARFFRVVVRVAP